MVQAWHYLVWESVCMNFVSALESLSFKAPTKTRGDYFVGAGLIPARRILETKLPVMKDEQGQALPPQV
jgi:hypothetical protein